MRDPVSGSILRRELQYSPESAKSTAPSLAKARVRSRLSKTSCFQHGNNEPRAQASGWRNFASPSMDFEPI